MVEEEVEEKDCTESERDEAVFQRGFKGKRMEVKKER